MRGLLITQPAIGRSGAALPPPDVAAVNAAVGVILAPPAHGLRHGFILNLNMITFNH